MKRRTMASIAAELDISRTAVSLVLKGEGDRYRISPGTQERIRALSASLDFRPSWPARALATGRSGVVGLVLPNVYEGFMGELVRGVEEVLHAEGRLMMLASSRFDAQTERRNLETLLDRGADAVILAPYAPFRGEAESRGGAGELLARAGVPAVCVDRLPRGWSGPAVLQDDRGAAARAVGFLAAAGARRIGFVSLDLDCSTIDGRAAGWREALAAAGLDRADCPAVLLRGRDRGSGDLEGALRDLYAGPRRKAPDAFLVATNGLSYRVRAIAAALGESPRIAKFGTDPEYWDTGMLGLRQPHFEMGRAAAGLALGSAGDSGKAGGAGARIVFDVPPAEGGEGRGA